MGFFYLRLNADLMQLAAYNVETEFISSFIIILLIVW